MQELQAWPFGKTTEYVSTYSPQLLCSVPRALGREKIGIHSSLPFNGADLWTGFELSWLNEKGKPEIAMITITLPIDSPNIVESKSMKLYLCSFLQTKFISFEAVRQTIQRDLSRASGGNVAVALFHYQDFPRSFSEFTGICLDEMDLETNIYDLEPSLLKTGDEIIEETLYSRLLKSNCLATSQPDWGNLLIHYKGKQIDHEGLLKYIISFRNHCGFAEHCVERIYMDILNHCQPDCLTVYARYLRRGGLDINPFRSNFELTPNNGRQIRQ
jgi:7-cyano-7-deazaguanine reductase